MNLWGFDSSFLKFLGNEFQIHTVRLKMEARMIFEAAKKLNDSRFDLGDSFMNFIGEKLGLSVSAGNSFNLHFRN